MKSGQARPECLTRSDGLACYILYFLFCLFVVFFCFVCAFVHFALISCTYGSIAAFEPLNVMLAQHSYVCTLLVYI